MSANMGIESPYLLAITIVPFLLNAVFDQVNAQQFVNYSDPGGAFTIQYPEAWEISTPADRLNSP